MICKHIQLAVATGMRSSISHGKNTAGRRRAGPNTGVMRKKDDDRARSINLMKEDSEEEDSDLDEETRLQQGGLDSEGQEQTTTGNAATAAAAGEVDSNNDQNKNKSAWAMGGDYKDHVIQNIIFCGSQLGVYKHVPVPGRPDEQQKVFYRGLYAADEVDALRRLLIDQDDPVNRELMIFVSSINMVSQYLTPLFVQSDDEKPFALSLIRLFLLLTKPLAKSVSDALSHLIRKSKGKESVDESNRRVAKELSVRKNAYLQIKAQLMFKECLVQDHVFVVLLKYIEEPLSRASHQRTEEDKVVIELILTLVNNLLRISAGTFSSPDELRTSQILHNKLILVLQGPFMDIVLLLCQGVNERDNNPWRTILMEIVHFILG